MKVTLIWEHGILTRLQSANALKIALKWLYKYDDLLSVFCATTQTMYIREAGMIVTIYDVKISVFLELVSAGYECQGYREGIKVFNVEQIRSNDTELMLISNGKSIIIKRKDFGRVSFV